MITCEKRLHDAVLPGSAPDFVSVSHLAFFSSIRMKLRNHHHRGITTTGRQFVFGGGGDDDAAAAAAAAARLALLRRRGGCFCRRGCVLLLLLIDAHRGRRGTWKFRLVIAIHLCVGHFARDAVHSSMWASAVLVASSNVTIIVCSCSRTRRVPAAAAAHPPTSHKETGKKGPPRRLPTRARAQSWDGLVLFCTPAFIEQLSLSSAVPVGTVLPFLPFNSVVTNSVWTRYQDLHTRTMDSSDRSRKIFSHKY